MNSLRLGASSFHLRFMLAAVLIAALSVALVPSPAMAQCPGPTPPGCNANALSISSIGPDKTYYHNGEYAFFTVTVENEDSNECDVTETRVWFTQPAPDGTASGNVGNLTVNHTFRANGLDDTTYTYSGGTYPILRYLINADYGVTSMSVRGQADGVLNNGKVVTPCDRATDLKEVSLTLLWPSVRVTKWANNTISKVGDSLTYFIMVENTSLSGLSLDPVSVFDDHVGNVTGDFGTLAAGANETESYVYTVLGTDDDPLINRVDVIYEDLTGYAVANFTTHSITLLEPSIDVTKTANVTTAGVGDWVEYEVVIENTSPDTALNLVSVDDTLLGDLTNVGTWGAEAFTTSPLAIGANETHYYSRQILGTDPSTLVNTVEAHYSVTGLPNDITDSDDATVEIQYAALDIYKFYDYNCDGVQNGSDVPISGWYFEASGGAWSDNGTTDGTGHLVFSPVLAGTYQVTEETFAGWANCTATTKSVVVPLGGTGYATFSNRQIGNLTIYKFYDHDCNHTEDGTDGPISGWHFDVTGTYWSGSGDTDGTGYLTFTDIPAGDYSVTEETRTDWENCDGPTKPVTVPFNDTGSVEFGNREIGNLTIYKVYDYNCNGVEDVGDHGQGSWPFTVAGAYYSNSGSTGLSPAGYLKFTDIPAGSYTVTEGAGPGAGWQSCSATVQVANVPAGGEDTVTFFNRQVGDITVHKFYDHNCDGTKNGADYDLPGWEFDLDNGLFSGSGTTGAGGLYTFVDVPYGPLANITETMKPNWEACTSTFRQVAVIPGVNRQVDFGNREVGNLTIQKYRDNNQNHTWDGGPPDELLGSGWQFTISGPDPTVGGTYTTGPSGNIVFTNILAGSYTITEINIPLGWINTDPPPDNTVVQKVEVVNAGDVDVVYFGNYVPTTELEIFKYHDYDKDGVRDPNEEGLNGWHFVVKGFGFFWEGYTPFSTEGGPVEDGLIHLGNMPEGDYTVTEILKNWWMNTDPGGDPPYQKTVNLSGGVQRLYFGNIEQPTDIPPLVPAAGQWGIVGMIALFGVGLAWTVNRRRQRHAQM